MTDAIVLDKEGLKHLWERIKKYVGGGRKIPGRKYLSVSQ